MGEFPEHVDRKKGCFSGRQGWLLDHALSNVGWDRDDCHLTYAVACRPEAGRRLSLKEWRQAMECCQPRLKNELPRAPILALGKLGTRTVLGKLSVDAWRGYMYKDEQNHRVYPTYAPYRIFKNPAYWPIWLEDFHRAKKFFGGRLQEWKWPTRIIHEGEDMLKALTMCSNASSVGVDIEGTGLDPFASFIRTVGIATPEIAVSIPWPTSHPTLKKSIEEAVIQILKNPKIEKTFHNGNFDVLAFEALGIEVNNFGFDTLVAHHVLAPQLQHDLGFVATEFPAPRWKTEFKVTDDRKSFDWAKVDDEELRIYNCGDALMTAKLAVRLKERIKKRNLQGHLKQAMSVCHINRQMQQKGIAVDRRIRGNHQGDLTERADKLRHLLVAACPDLGLDEGGEFNPASTAQLRTLFFKHYGCKPRYTTGSGLVAINKATLDEICKDPVEPREARETAEKILEWRKYVKVLSTYVEGLPVTAGGRVHPSWKVTTITQRHNSSGPNMQNVPKGSKGSVNMRDMFVSDPGTYFVEADYSTAEPRVQALRAGQRDLIQRFNEDDSFNYHSYFAQKILGIDEKDWDHKNIPAQDKQRTNLKIVNLGDNYGATAETLWRQVVANSPDITVKAIEQIQRFKREKFPDIEAQRQKDLVAATKHGRLELPFGAGTFYYYLNIVRPTQVYNLPMQSGVAKVMNDAMIRIAARIDWETEAIVLQVHDALTLQGPDPQRLLDILCEEMPCWKDHEGRKMRFPIEACWGTNWGHMEELGECAPGGHLEIQ